jgi:15-cis-phytoene synthase/lycopene beta-cyclase
LQIAVVSTIPWDSYLIRHQIWTYPPNAIVGPTFWQIPAEELFFFIVQTYNTSLLYLLFSKPTFHPIFLSSEHQSAEPSSCGSEHLRMWKLSGQIVLSAAIIAAAWAISNGGVGMYFGLIVIWAAPFLLLLWLVLFSVAKNQIDFEQEPFVSIPGRTAVDKHHLAHCTSNMVPVDCRHSRFEARDLGN